MAGVILTSIIFKNFFFAIIISLSLSLLHSLSLSLSLSRYLLTKQSPIYLTITVRCCLTFALCK